MKRSKQLNDQHKYKKVENSKSLIIFFIPPENTINGGIISIFSLCKESRRFHTIHKSDVVLSVMPSFSSYKKNNLFQNDEYIYSFEEIIKKYPKLDSLVVHIPEYAIGKPIFSLDKYTNYIESIKHFQINILNQNIELMPIESDIASLYRFTNIITQTTAHNKYCSQKIADKYAIPTHLFSTLIDASQYQETNYNKKLNQIVISNDSNPQKSKILRLLSSDLPQYKQIIVDNMTHQEYKDLVSISKFTITFGEGFDGYNIESVFSGTLPFAVYNEEFFPSKDYLGLKNIYESYDSMLKNIVPDINNFENEHKYKTIIKENFFKINNLYNFNTYLENIKKFYQKKYTYLPRNNSMNNFLLSAVSQKDSIINEQKMSIETYSKKIQQLEEENDIALKTVKRITESTSWSITAPLRNMSNAVRSIKSKK